MSLHKINIKLTVVCYFIALIAIMVLSVTSCTQEDEAILPYSDKETIVKVSIQNTNPTIMDNISMYAFDEYDSYDHTPSLTKLIDTLYTTLHTTTWNLYFLSCIDQNITNNIYFQSPQKSVDIRSMKMWQTGKLSGDTLLDIIPEILYAKVPNVIINSGVNKKTATLSRNVAKIQVILNYSGFNTAEITSSVYANDRYVELYNIPTTINWLGELYPNKNTPTLANVPLREYVTFDASNKADTVNFIVPAHRGIDALGASPTDTTTQKIQIKACLPYNGKRFFGKVSTPIEVPFVPKMNHIMRINLLLSTDTKLDIKVTVKDWGNYIDQTDTFN